MPGEMHSHPRYLLACSVTHRPDHRRLGSQPRRRAQRHRELPGDSHADVTRSYLLSRLLDGVLRMLQAEQPRRCR
jgi:hypothetical protein